MDAEEIDAAAAAAELNILGGLASVTGLQSPAPTRPSGATANNVSNGEASPIPSASAAPSGVANDSPQGAVPATPSAVTITTEQLAMLGGIMATAMKDAMGAAGGTTPGSTLGGTTSPIGETYTGSTSGSVVFQQAGQKESVDLRYLEAQVRKLTSLQQIPALNQPSAEIAKAGVAWILEIKAQAEELGIAADEDDSEGVRCVIMVSFWVL